MADDINKKISIDVQVNTDGQQQIDQYKQSLDSLRYTISNLDKPLTELSANIRSLDNDVAKFTASFSGLNAQNNDFVSIGEKVNTKVAGLVESFKAWKEVIGALGLVSKGWVGIVAKALALLSQFGPAILDWIGKMNTGSNTVTAFTKALKDYKIIMEAVKQTQLQGTLDAQQELTHLKLLYNASQDQKISYQERKKVMAELRSEYPAYFGNMTDEMITTGKAAKAYDSLTKSIIATSKARAAGNLMTKNSERQLLNDTSVTKLTEQLKNLNKEMLKAKKEYDAYTSNPAIGGGTVPGDTEESSLYQKLSGISETINKTKKQIADLNTDSNLLIGKNNALAKTVMDNTEKYGATVVGVSQRATAQQVQATDTVTKTQREALIKQLQATNSIYAQQALDENSHYNDQKKSLDHLLKNNLISLSQYHAEAEKLESEHSSKITGIIDSYIKDDAAKVESHQQQLVTLEAKGTALIQNTLSDIKVEHVNLLTAYEDADAKAIESAKRRADFEKQMAQKVSDTTFAIISKSVQAQSQAKIKALENDKARELSNTSLTATQRQAIEAKYKKQEDAVKLKAFKDEQKTSIAQAIINGALAVTKAEAQTGVLGEFAIPAIIAQTAMQVATIVAQKPPAMAKGGYFTSDGKGALLPGYSRTDNTNAYLRSGEAVVVSEAMRDPWARNLVSAINVAYGGRDFSVPGTSRGYAVGGIFTDGGNANRYYNQPMNDQKNLANTIAYQMINNFPPVYVDVKDINNQQNILAQTINRVNL